MLFSVRSFYAFLLGVFTVALVGCSAQEPSKIESYNYLEDVSFDSLETQYYERANAAGDVVFYYTLAFETQVATGSVTDAVRITQQFYTESEGIYSVSGVPVYSWIVEDENGVYTVQHGEKSEAPFLPLPLESHESWSVDGVAYDASNRAAFWNLSTSSQLILAGEVSSVNDVIYYSQDYYIVKQLIYDNDELVSVDVLTTPFL